MVRKACIVAMATVMSIAYLPAQTTSWRPTIVAQHGMIAAGHPLAAEAGMRILKAGGNAIDAAIATWAVQGEVEPGMTGLGADMFVLYYNAKTGQVKFINGTGFPVSEALASGIQSARAKIAKFPSTTKIYFKDGKPLVMGDIIRNPDLS